MLTIKKMNSKVNIDYTKNDTFKFSISADESSGVIKLRFQIAENEISNEVLIDKEFTFENNTAEVSLKESEINKLYIDRMYSYRLTFLSGNDTTVTMISGNLNVKWGA